MKTTMILNDAIVKRAKQLAQKENTSLTKVVEEALVFYLKENSLKNNQVHQINITPYGSGGYIDPDLEGNWPEVRKRIYRDS